MLIVVVTANVGYFFSASSVLIARCALASLITSPQSGDMGTKEGQRAQNTKFWFSHFVSLLEEDKPVELIGFVPKLR